MMVFGTKISGCVNRLACRVSAGSPRLSWVSSGSPRFWFDQEFA